MANAYTNRGKKWETAKSWWIVLTFLPFGFTSFIAFLYAGFKVKNQRWRLYGFGYLGVFTVAYASTSTGFGAAVGLIIWIVSIVHAFKIRPAFLVQLDVLKSNKHQMRNKEIAKLREEAEAKFKVDGEMKSQPPLPNVKNVQPPFSETHAQVNTPENKNTASSEKETSKIDINTAAESEIAAIPAIGIILAKKVVKKREDLGGFESFEQFKEIMELKPHTIDKVKQFVAFSKLEKSTGSVSGRIIDF